MLRVLSNALSAPNCQRVTLVWLTTALDCVDYSLVLKQLQLEFGFVDSPRLGDVLHPRQNLASRFRQS